MMPSGGAVLSRRAFTFPAASRTQAAGCPALAYEICRERGSNRPRNSVTKLIRLRVLPQEAVHEGQYLADIAGHPRNGSQNRPCRRHEQCGSKPVTGDIADNDRVAHLGQGDVIVVVATGKLGRKRRPGHVEPARLGGRSGKRRSWMRCAAIIWPSLFRSDSSVSMRCPIWRRKCRAAEKNAAKSE